MLKLSNYICFRGEFQILIVSCNNNSVNRFRWYTSQISKNETETYLQITTGGYTSLKV